MHSKTRVRLKNAIFFGCCVLTVWFLWTVLFCSRHTKRGIERMIDEETPNGSSISHVERIVGGRGISYHHRFDVTHLKEVIWNAGLSPGTVNSIISVNWLQVTDCCLDSGLIDIYFFFDFEGRLIKTHLIYTRTSL